MSIARALRKILRSFRSLIVFARATRVFIKVLTDLENGTIRVSIDIKDLKDLKRHRLTMEIAGDRPPRYDEKKRCLSHRGGQAPALRCR